MASDDHAARAGTRRNDPGILRAMAEQIEFSSNGDEVPGYLVLPPGGTGPGVIVIQEWWGLDSGCKAMAERLAQGGFVALAPDLYRGQLAGHDEMDKAAELMGALPADRAARDLSGAVDALAGHAAVTSEHLGIVGFCMGGMLTFLLAANRPDRIKAAVPFYGFPQGDAEPDWGPMTAVVRGHMAEQDDFFGPDAARALEAKLQGLGKDVTLTVHPGNGHAFMGPHNALGTFDEALSERLWPEVLAFLHDQLG
jgi:carboxymethylenebutenolidase